MESTFKEHSNEWNQHSNHDDVQASHSGKTPSTPELSQLELITQWQINLEQLLEDLGFSSSESDLIDELDGLVPDINEKLAYLNKTDNLLQEHDDFVLSDAGFEKYKSANLAIVRYLTQLYQEEQLQEEGDRAVKFYFLSRAKHIKQQDNTIPWLFSFYHFLLLIVATAALIYGGYEVKQLSQGNGVVLVLLIFISFTLFDIAKNKVRAYKATALTPIRFSISLLSIFFLTTALYAVLLIAIPSFIVKMTKAMWLDDVMIIGLGIFAFILLTHSGDINEESAKLSSFEVEK